MAQLQATTVAGDLAVDTDALVVFASDNKVAINQASAGLDVELDVNGRVEATVFRGSGAELTDIAADTAEQLIDGDSSLSIAGDELVFNAGGTDVLFVDDNGDIRATGDANFEGGSVRIGEEGVDSVVLLNDSGTIRLRNDADTDYGNLTVGDLTVEGTTTIVNSTQVDIGEQFLLLNPGQDEITDPTQLQSAGIRIERGTEDNASLLWDEGDDVWKAGTEGAEIQIARFGDNLSEFTNDLDLSDFGQDLNSDDIPEGSANLYFTEGRVYDALLDQLVAGVGIDLDEDLGAESITFNVTLDGLTTDALDEGSGNLYFERARVNSMLVGGDGIDITVDGITEEATFDVVLSEVIGQITTDDINEGSVNLFFTDVRAVDALEAAPTLDLNDVTVNDLTVDGTVTIAGTLSSDQITEGSTNLFFEDERVFAALQAQLVAGDNVTFDVDVGAETLTINADAGDLVSELTTDDLAEGSVNLYFTDERAVDALEAEPTLALNDVTVNDLVVDGTMTINGTLSSDELTEGSTNLFFTDGRVFDALQAQLLAGDHITFDVDAGADTLTVNADADSLIGTLSTDDLAEGSTNLYYTDARVIDATEVFLVGGDGITITRVGDDIEIQTTLGDLDEEYIRADGDTAEGDYDFNTGLFVLNQSANTINSDGDITTTGTLTAQEIIETSTIRVKENVQTMGRQISNFMKLRPVQFDWKEISDKKNDKGLIAEEVAEVYPEFVHIKDGQATGVNYSKLTSVLINVVQELTQKVENLEAARA